MATDTKQKVDFSKLSIEELQKLATELTAAHDTLKSSNESLAAEVTSLKEELSVKTKTMIVDEAPVELVFRQFDLKDKRKFEFAQAENGAFLVDGIWYTPKGIMDMKKDERNATLEQLVAEHPTLFKEIFN